MTSQALGNSDDSWGLHWEEVLSILAVLTLAGVFIWYQAFPGDSDSIVTAETAELIPLTSTKTITPAPVVSETPKHIVEEVSAPETSAPVIQKTASIEPMTAAMEPMPAELKTPAVATVEVIEAPVVEAPVIETIAVVEPDPVPAPVIVEPSPAPAPIEAPVQTPQTAFEMVRNIQTNEIEFSGKVAPSSQVKLVIDGEASEVLDANEIGVWSYKKIIEAGLYTFEVQNLDAQQAVSSSSIPATYQILPINESSSN